MLGFTKSRRKAALLRAGDESSALDFHFFALPKEMEK
jgi:hypothetical protein